ncbi:hypothetical protein C8Q72DRAFT_795269 [Fomitopsis betulina]|nr:hypothetical protein C8Q72DRAFT_795269 [Fomitopsis betulina]
MPRSSPAVLVVAVVPQMMFCLQGHETMQRMYIWRSAFGDSAIEAVKQLWEDGRIVGQDEGIACAEFALMKGDPYLYGEVTTAEQGNETVVIGNSARPLYTGG